jgi:hypothetical protein
MASAGKNKRTRVALPPPSELSTDPELAEYQTALGLRSYTALETQNILGVGESLLARLVQAGELRPHVHGAKQWSFWGPSLARFLWQRERQRKAASPPTPVPRTGTEKPEKRQRGRPRKGPIRSVPAAE